MARQQLDVSDGPTDSRDFPRGIRNERPSTAVAGSPDVAKFVIPARKKVHDCLRCRLRRPLGGDDVIRPTARYLAPVRQGALENSI